MSRRVVLIAAALAILAGSPGACGARSSEAAAPRAVRRAKLGPTQRIRADRMRSPRAIAHGRGKRLSRPSKRRPRDRRASGCSSRRRAKLPRLRQPWWWPGERFGTPHRRFARSAVRELVRQDDQDAIRALRRLARRDPSPEVRAAAEEGLRELGAEDAIAETDEGPTGPEDPSETGEIPPDRPGTGDVDYDSLSTGSLVALLSHPDLDVRESAVDSLGYNEHYGAIPALWDAFFFASPAGSCAT